MEHQGLCYGTHPKLVILDAAMSKHVNKMPRDIFLFFFNITAPTHTGHPQYSYKRLLR